MAGRNGKNLIWIIIAVIFAAGVIGTLAGWWPSPFGGEEICGNPSGCQCGILATCERGQSCVSSVPGLFGHCEEL